MTPEEKLNHLKDFMEVWIDWKLSRVGYVNQFWYFYTMLGIILSPSMRTDENEPTFENHLRLIENK